MGTIPAGFSETYGGGLIREEVPGKPSAQDRRRAVLRVFLICWLVYTAFWGPYIVREHFPAIALAEQGTLNVERYLGWTEDIFSGPIKGAFINNNPGASLTAAIPLMLLRPVLARVDAWNQRQSRPDHPEPGEGEVFGRALREGRGCYFLLIVFLTTAAIMAPATAGMLAYLCSRLIEAGLPATSASLVTILCGLGTPLLFRAGNLNHNLLVADAGFTALLILWDPGNRPLTLARAAAAGLLCGYALLCDYSSIVVVAVTAFYAWQRSAGKSSRMRIATLAGFAGGTLPGVAVLLIYQAWAFGSFYHPSQHYMPPTGPTAHGYRGFDWPSPSLAWALLTDPRFGLFAYCPALVLAFGAPFAKGIRYRLPRRETRLILIYFALFLVFCSANQYSRLQPLTGFRYLVPVVPGLALLTMQTAQALPRLVRQVLGWFTCLQMVALSASHENDVRRVLATLWESRLKPLWLIRLGQSGTPAAWIHAAELLASIALIAALFGVMALFRETAEIEVPRRL
jgi:hypothetical protein